MGLLLDAGVAGVERARLPQQVQALLEAEQRHLGPQVDRRRIGAGDDPALDSRFRPGARRVFRLPAFWAPAGVTIGPDASGWLRALFVRGRQALCLAHPLNPAVPRGWSGPELLATPTASLRTLLVWQADRPQRPFFAKLSLPLLLGGERRTLNAGTAAACVRRSTLLRAFGAKGLVPLAETLAIASPTGAFLIRELPSRAWLTPWFALTEGELLASLAARHRVSRERLVRELLLRPFLRAWMTSAVEHGWTPEAHAQNLLVERNADGLLTGRFFVRDLEDVGVDLPFIAAAHPRFRSLARALDTRAEQDFGEGLEQSLHGYFLSGPVHALRARRLFFDELSRVMGVEKPVLDPRAFRSWVEARREERLAPPACPAPLARWLRLEQRVNSQRRSPRHFAPVSLRAIPSRFLPSNAPVFRLPYLEVPLRKVRVRADRVPNVLRRALFLRRNGKTLVRCFFHPMMAEAHALEVAEHGQGLETFWATPTASPRSLVVWPERQPAAAFGLKVSLDVELLRLNRVVRTKLLERAVAVSGCLASGEALPEPVSTRLLDQEWGNVARVLTGRMQRWVPGFALFADGPDGQPPLVVSLAGAGAPAEQVVSFIERMIWGPLVKTFARLAFGEGLLPAMHQQNVLFDRGRVLLRDLDSCVTDLELRWRRGKTLEPFARSAGTLQELKLNVGSSRYDEAWSHSLRADWAWLAQDCLLRHARLLGGIEAVRGALAGRRLWATLDALVLEETARWLGAPVVHAELLHLFHRTGVAPRRLSDRSGDPRYALNAIVQAWKLTQGPGPPEAKVDLRRPFREAAALGRATVELERSHRLSRSHGLLIATDQAGRVRGFALEHHPGAACR